MKKKCDICRGLFKPRNDFETMCFGCYHKNRVQNHKEEKSKLQFQIDYLQDQNCRLLEEKHRWSKCSDEILDREILKDFMFICHNNQNVNGERLKRITKWMNRFYSLLLKKELIE